MYPNQNQPVYSGGVTVTGGNSRRKKLLMIGGVFLLLIVVAIAAASSLGGSSRKSAKLADNFVNLYVAGDARGTYELLAPETARSESIESWTTKVVSTKDFFSDYQTIKIDDEQEKSQTNTHGYIAKGSDGLYLFTIATSDNGVISFDSSPYIDVRGEIK